LCGRPKAARERMVLGVISRAYMDESGGTDDSARLPTKILAGCIAPYDNWTGFSEAWQGVLTRYGVDRYHGYLCNRLEPDPDKPNPFQRLDIGERNDLQLALARTLAGADPFVFVVRMSIADHGRIVRPALAERSRRAKRSLGWDAPQGFMTSKTIIGVLCHLYEHRTRPLISQYILDWQPESANRTARPLRAIHPFFAAT